MHRSTRKPTDFTAASATLHQEPVLECERRTFHFRAVHIDSDDRGSAKPIDLDRKTLSDRDLVIRQYMLPEGYWFAKFKLVVNNRAKQYSNNRYMVCARLKTSVKLTAHQKSKTVLVVFSYFRFSRLKTICFMYKHITQSRQD